MTERHLQDSTVAIVGLGMMGTSLGLALDERCLRRVGVDVDPDVASRALELGAIDVVGSATDIVPDADLVVLCLPIARIIDAIPQVAAEMQAGAVLTDIGSTKSQICDGLDQIAVASVGGHPMCGSEQSGPDAASAKLYEGATWALCATTTSNPQARALVGELVLAAGATAVDIDRADHDRDVAVVSHLPYAVAQALTVLPDETALTLASTGFSGATRMAAGDVEMWRDILLTNQESVRLAIDSLRGELGELATLLDDPAALEHRLQLGRAARARLPRA